MALKGGPALRKRLKALSLAFKPLGRKWADETVTLARPMVPYRTGRLRSSIRVKSATQKRATVAAHFTATFVDGGTQAHDIKPKHSGTLVFQSSGRTIFARKVHHRGAKARPFKVRAAKEALRRTPMAEAIIDAWNGAA